MTTNRTPGPWLVRRSLIVDERGIHIAEIILPPYAAGDAQSKQWAEEQEAANAAFIVQACNAHDELVAALRDIADAAYGTDTPKLRQRARAALAKVKA